MSGDRIPVDELREAILASDVGWGTAAARLGWTRKHSSPYKSIVGDGARLKRDVGVLPRYTRGHAKRAETIDYDKAVKIADAYGFEYTDVGL